MMLPAQAMSFINSSQYQGVEALRAARDRVYTKPAVVERVAVAILHSLQETLALGDAPMLEAQLMAIAEINETGGVLGHKIGPVIADEVSDSDRFEQKARKIIAENQITTIFGCSTSASLKRLLLVAEEFNAQLWYPLQYEGLECYPNIFYTGACINQQVEPAIAWLLQHRRKRFYLLGADDVFSHRASKIIKSQLPIQGGTVVGEAYMPKDAVDFTETIAHIKHTQPDAIVNTLSGENNQAFYRQYFESGMTADEIKIVACNVLAAELNEIGGYAQGTYVSASYFPSLDLPSNRKFINNFQQRYGNKRVISSAIEAAYTQIYLWKGAVELAESFEVDRVGVAALGSSFLAPSGLVTISANHHVARTNRIGRIMPTGKVEIVFSSDRPIKPLPWLGVEQSNFSTSEIEATLRSDGGKQRALFVAQDITELCLPGSPNSDGRHSSKRAEEALQAANAALEDKVQERTAALKESNDQLVAEIVKHQQAENALRAAKDQLEAVLAAVPGIVSWISSDLRYLEVNRHLANMFDLPPEAFVGKDIGFLGTSSEFKEFVRSFFASPQQETFREISAIVGGEPRNYLIVVQKYDGDRAAFTVGIDITERKRAEEELRATKEQLEAVLAAVPGIVSWISSDLRYLEVNRHLANMFDLPPEAFVGKDIGFLGTSNEFKEFVRSFFASRPQQDAFREISAVIKGSERNYLIVAQKYDGDRAVFTIGIDITDRKRVESDLRQAEARYRHLFENTVEGIFQTTPDGHYLSANPALARIYGYESPEQLIANITSIQDQLYLDPDRRSEFIQLLQSGDGVMSFESQIKHRDGRITWISENACAVLDENGNLLYYEGTVEDITERKQAELALQRANEELEIRVSERTAALRESNHQLRIEIAERQRMEAALRVSEAELRALFAAMTDIITVFDASGRYIKIVSTNSEVLYSPKAERLGKTVYEVLPAEQADFFVRNIQHVLNTGQTVNLEYCLPFENSQGKYSRIPCGSGAQSPIAKSTSSNSQEVWFSASVSPMPDNCVIWVARNITERKRMIDAMQEAEEKYRSIFENAAEGIYQSTPDGRYLSVNPALARMFGYSSPEELMSHLTNVAAELYVDPNRRMEFIAALELDDAVSHFESQVYRQNGNIIWTSENARTVRDEQGKLLYYEGIVEDITERKGAEETLLAEQEKSEGLLLNILPHPIAQRLKQDQHAIAERFDDVSIMFADIVDFTGLSADISPTRLVCQLNEIFSAFDQLALAHGLEKIKTIGDAYMVAGGLPTPRPDHPQAIAEMALDMQRKITQFKRDDGKPFHLRIGINTGPVVAGVIGLKKFAYDLWGDAVNVASRMESHGSVGGIQVTAATYDRLKSQFLFKERGAIDVKGKGKMNTYWLIGRKVK